MNTWFSFVARATTRQVSQSTTADDVNVSGGLSLRVDSGDVVRGQTWTCASASECSTARLGDGLASRSWVILARVPFDASSVGDVTFRRISSSHAMMFARGCGRSALAAVARRVAAQDAIAPTLARAALAPTASTAAAAAASSATRASAGVPFASAFAPTARAIAGPDAWRAFSTVVRATQPRPASVAPVALVHAARRALSTAAAAAPSSAIPPHPLVAGGAAAERLVGAWLVGGCAWVFSMVVLGGVTRLTRSGLSMTDWKFEWERPPTTPEHWEEEFAKYRASPEFRMANARMTVDEYKFIFWMEYGHRMWGRALGAYFALPLAAFAAKGWITRALAGRLFGFFGLGAAQGVIGWWMVKSGLTEHPDAPTDVPRVSPYRLATHLTGAFTIYAAMIWTTFTVYFPTPPAVAHAEAHAASGAPERASAAARGAVFRATRAAKARAHPLAGLIALTALSGAYVAGLDAGRAYNTFPLMGGRIVPEEYWAQWEAKGWRNFFENTAAAQFDHRALAMTTLAATTAVWATRRGDARLPPAARACLDATMGVAAAQVAIGIATLLHHVPVTLGSLHQANALALFTAVVGLMHALRVPRGAGAVAAAAKAARG